MKNRRSSSLPSFAISVPQIEFYGREQVTVEESHGVIISEYDTETVKLNAGRQKIRFYGNGLTLKNLTPTSVMICGEVSSFEFEE